MARIPSSVRREVIAELYRQFDQLGWEERTQVEVSTAYECFVEDPNIGGQLKQYIPSERIRVWIKDGPAKEYRRALEGVGPYSKFTRRTAVGPDAVVVSALGRSWKVVSGSVRHKPMRCLVTNGSDESLLVWGPEKSLKELFFYAATYVADNTGATPVIVLTKRGNAPIDAVTWKRAQSLGRVIGARVVQTSLSVTWKPDQD